MAEELRACPFCGGTKISYSTHQIGIAVGCDSCGAVCEIKGSKEQCASAWNTRAQPPSQGGEAVAPGIEAAYAIGAKGGVASDAERAAFEAWMAGHCWALCAVWDGNGYRCESEQGGHFNPAAAMTRRLWAAWRDRAALATHPADQVEDDLNMVKVSRELLQDLRDLAFDQVEHHRAAMGAYKQTRQSAMDSVLAQADALLRS